LLLVAFHLAGTVNIQPARSQATIPHSDSAGINSIAPGTVLLAQTETVVPPHLRALDLDKVGEAVPLIEQTWETDYEQYFRTSLSDRSITAKAIADTLSRLSKQTGKKTALLYIVPREEQLELVLVTPGGQPVHKRIKAANRQSLLAQVQQFTTSITNASTRNTKRYLPAAQQLYKWMVAPVEADLKAQNIDALLFCVGEGLRTLPLAALHDGRQFLVEKYSYSRIPAFKLTDITYTDLRNSPVLAMGASEFKDQNPLPAVPVELSTIAKGMLPGRFFLNQEFTLSNLQSQRRKQTFKIIHLATHADFKSGSPNNSFIQFWDIKLTLDKMRQLRWNNPPVDLLVLSACKTAMGDRDAELGFAGLAVQARVKSAIASLWNVSDEGTLALMTEFYRDLKTAPIKAEALQQAQIAMLKGQVRLENGQLRTRSGNISLPPVLAALENEDLSPPYYWAAFTVVGSPW
jgi:CHAT domain-containing protein